MPQDMDPNRFSGSSGFCGSTAQFTRAVRPTGKDVTPTVATCIVGPVGPGPPTCVTELWMGIYYETLESPKPRWLKMVIEFQKVKTLLTCKSNGLPATQKLHKITCFVQVFGLDKSTIIHVLLVQGSQIFVPSKNPRLALELPWSKYQDTSLGSNQ